MIGLILLTLGVALWIAAHLFKRVAPAQRQTLESAMGEAAKGVFAVLILAGLVLMVVGYRMADPEWFWFAPPWMGHVNNLLVLVSFYVFGISMARGALSQKLRHPMLLGTLIWAVAHLMVKGSLAGVILFGGLALWAVLSIVMINASERNWTPKPPKGGIKRDLVAIPIVVVTYGVVGIVHRWLGVNPFGNLGG